MSSTSKLAYIILALLIGYFFVYTPYGDLSELMSKKQEYKKSIETMSNIESIENSLAIKFGDISDDDKKNIDTILPNSLNLVRLVSQIDAVASNYGISIGGITSKGVSSSVGGSVKEASPQKPYKSSTVGFTFNTSYENFNIFMRELGRSMRILDIRSVNITPNKDGLYSYDVEFETYWIE